MKNWVVRVFANKAAKSLESKKQPSKKVVSSTFNDGEHDSNEG